MKNSHHMNYFFGDDLKEIPEDAVEFNKGIEFWKAQLPHINNIKDKGKLLSTIGVHLRIAGRLNEALTYLNEVKLLLESSSLNRAFIVNEIRIAQTLQWQKRFDEATILYDQIEKLICSDDPFSNLLHFVYQHQGKNYFDQQKYELAKRCIEKALAIRKELKDANLISSSTFALDIISLHLEIN